MKLLRSYLVVGEVVQALVNENLKHHQPIEWRAPRVAALLRLVESHRQNRRKNMLVNMFFKLDERVLELGESFKQKLFVEQTFGVDVFHTNTNGLMGTA
jgi:hypothetical protein